MYGENIIVFVVCLFLYLALLGYMPKHLGPWPTVYPRFRVGEIEVIFNRMLKRPYIRLNGKV